MTAARILEEGGGCQPARGSQANRWQVSRGWITRPGIGQFNAAARTPTIQENQRHNEPNVMQGGGEAGELERGVRCYKRTQTLH